MGLLDYSLLLAVERIHTPEIKKELYEKQLGRNKTMVEQERIRLSGKGADNILSFDKLMK